MRRLLIIEDDTRQNDLLARDLRGRGFVCHQTYTFAEGVKASFDESFDCAVVDLGLPDEDLKTDYDTAKRLREINCPVVALTGSGDKDLVGAVRGTGAAFVLKPGGELLVEKILSQINFRSPDPKSETSMQESQRKLIGESKGGLWTAIRENTLALIVIVGGAASTGMWLNGTISDKVKDAQNVAHRLENMDSRIKTREDYDTQSAVDLKIVQNQNQISIDDRKAMHDTMAQFREDQRKLETDLVRRLERIEEKLDHQKSL